jgi:hypothetical protein
MGTQHFYGDQVHKVSAKVQVDLEEMREGGRIRRIKDGDSGPIVNSEQTRLRTEQIDWIPRQM